MEELKLPVIYKGEELEFPLRVVPQGYVSKLAVLVDGVEVIYEQDEQGAYRALILNPDLIDIPLPDTALLAAIGEVIQSLSS